MTVHLSILIFWPLLLAVLGGLAPRAVAPLFALVGALVPLGYAVIMLVDFDPAASGLQYLTDDAWIDELGIRYTLGVDGLNLWLVALTALLFAASALWLVLRPPARPKLFAVHFGIAETAVLGAFLAQDLALFVLFFDLMLVPFYFLLGQWGGQERVPANSMVRAGCRIVSVSMTTGLETTRRISAEASIVATWIATMTASSRATCRRWPWARNSGPCAKGASRNRRRA